MRPENRHGHACLDCEGLVIFEVFQRIYDSMKAFPVAGRLADAAIDD
jgi:hypothetical protein